MNNPSIIEKKEKEQKEQLELLGLTKKNIANNKKIIAKVDEKKANELGEKLVQLIGSKDYNEDNDAKYKELLELIKNGANLNFETSKGNFPLLLCARKGYVKTFVTLLKFGANVHKVNKNETTVVMSSARHGHLKILEISLIMGVDVNALYYDGDTALISAKAHGMKDCFEKLIEYNAILNIKNYLNLTSYETHNLDGGPDIDDAKYYSQVPTNPVIEATHEDAMELIYEAKNQLCNLTESLSIPTEIKSQDKSNIHFEDVDLPDEMTQKNINLSFKVK